MRERPDLTNAQKHQVVEFLLEGSCNGKVGHGRRAIAAQKFVTSQRTITRIWAAAMKQQKSGQFICLRNGKQNIRLGSQVKCDVEKIKNLPLGKRSSIRRLAHEVSCSPSTVTRWIKKKMLKPHTNAIKPELSAQNKLERLRFSLESLQLEANSNKLKFWSMHNVVHIDEKWFYMTKGIKRCYLTPGEEEPHRTCKSKKFICKVMFMCVVSRPLYGENGNVLFDGKIGIFPFTEQVPAKRASKNRVAGTLETKPTTSVTKDVIRECLINKILPAIREKWPISASKDIYIQQDNDKPHINNNDSRFMEAAKQEGFNFTLIQQPPNSPDTNINDLGWFRSLECLQHTTNSVTVDQLVGAVLNAFQTLDHTTLNNVFLSLQGCMIKIMSVRGGNNYKQPHIGKEALIRAGTLPTNLEVPHELVRDCLIYLEEAGETQFVEVMRNKLELHVVEEPQGEN